MIGRNRTYHKQILEVCRAIAAGDLEARITGIPARGEISEVMHAINEMIDRTDAYVRESQTCLAYVARNKYYRLINESGMTGSFHDASVSINKATWSIKLRNEEFSRIANSVEVEMRDVVDTVSQAIAELHTVSESVNESSRKTRAQSTAAATGAEEAAANMQSVAAAVEQLTGAVDEINVQVEQSAGITAEAVAKSVAMNDRIAGLADLSQSIGEFIQLISDIAAQTNLLALNATIEAACAGDSGKGFAVVAQEVKTLAGQTAKATEEITAQVAGIRQATASAVDANDEISQAIARVNEISGAIASSVGEQSASAREIADSVERAAAGTAEVSASVADLDASSQRTRQEVAGVVNASGRLAEQEKVLQRLRGEMSQFLSQIKLAG